MYMYMHMYISILDAVYIYGCIHMYISRCIRTCVAIDMDIYIEVYMCVYIYAYVCLHLYACTYALMYVWKQWSKLACTYVCSFVCMPPRPVRVRRVWWSSSALGLVLPFFWAGAPVKSPWYPSLQSGILDHFVLGPPWQFGKGLIGCASRDGPVIFELLGSEKLDLQPWLPLMTVLLAVHQGHCGSGFRFSLIMRAGDVWTPNYLAEYRKWG